MRSANASSTRASVTDWWRRCLNRAKSWQPRSPETKDRVYEGSDPGGEAEDHGRGCLFRRRFFTRTRPEPTWCVMKTPRSESTRRLTLRDGKLAGVILVGDTTDSHRYMDWLRVQNRSDVTASPASVSRARWRIPAWTSPQMPDNETVCGCMGVTKGTIIEAIHEKGIEYTCPAERMHARFDRLRKLHGTLPATAQGRGCRNSRKRPRKICASAFPSPKTTCAKSCAARSLRSVQEVLDIYGNGNGCEVCKPALSYMLDMLWCGDHDEDRSARFINDRVHANIQKDGTFSVVPRMRGGVTSRD